MCVCYGYVCVWVRVCTCACIPENVCTWVCKGRGHPVAGPHAGATCTKGHRGQHSTQCLGEPEPPTLLPPPQAPPQGLPGPNCDVFSKAICCILLFIYLFALISPPLHCLMSPGENYLSPPPQKKKKSIMEKRLIPGARREQRNPPGSVLSPVLGISPFHWEMV